MPHFVRLLVAAALAAAAGHGSGQACLTCGDVEAGGSLSMLDGMNAVADDVGISVETGFNFHRTDTAADRVLEAPGGAMAGTGTNNIPSLFGRVTLTGTPGRAVYVDLPRRIVLRGPGGDSITVAGIESDLPRAARLDDNGRLDFSFSGALSVPVLPSTGDYTADFTISASYE